MCGGKIAAAAAGSAGEVNLLRTDGLVMLYSTSMRTANFPIVSPFYEMLAGGVGDAGLKRRLEPLNPPNFRLPHCNRGLGLGLVGLLEPVDPVGLTGDLGVQILDVAGMRLGGHVQSGP